MLAAVATIAALAGVTPSPAPTPAIDPDLVTPGVWGFVAIVFVTLAVIVLVYDMMRRIRRGRYRADVREELDAEAAAQREADAAVEDPSTGSATSGADDRDVDPSGASGTDGRPER